MASAALRSGSGKAEPEQQWWLPKPDVESIKRAFKGVTLRDVMQLRMPLFLAVVIGRFCFSYSWLLIMMQFTISLYALFRTRREELRSHIDKQTAAEIKAQAAKEEKKSAISEKKVKLSATTPGAYEKVLPIVCLAGELYLHIIVGQFIAYQIGYFRMDTVLLLPLVEIIVFVERFFPTVQRQCQSRGLKEKMLWDSKFSSIIPNNKKEIFYETMAVSPVEVQDEWFNLLFAQWWQLYAGNNTWLGQYVRGFCEFFTAQLGLVTEVVDFGSIPLQFRKIQGKARTSNGSGGSIYQKRHPDDWIYDLDLHMELQTHEIMIRLAYPVAGFNFPIYVDYMRLSGAFRVEMEFLELDERDARAANPMFPGLAGLKIYFTERPEIDLSLWVGGLFDLVGIPLIGWIIQKLVVDNILCYSTMLGPHFQGQGKMDIGGNSDPIGGAVAKILALKRRDQKRTAEGDLDVATSMNCRLAVKVMSAVHLPADCNAYCILNYGTQKQFEECQPEELEKKGVSKRTRSHDGKPAHMWDKTEDRPFEWETHDDDDVLKIVLMSMSRMSKDVELGEFQCKFGELRDELDLKVNHSAKLKEIRMGQDEKMIVNIEVQFKALADLKGIKIEKGTKLMIAQGIKKDNNVSDQENVRPFVQEAPLQHVGGKLRIRLFRIDNVPQGCRTREGGNIYVRVACGRLSNYGSKIDEKKNPGFVDTMTKTQGAKLNLQIGDCVARPGQGAGVEREWSQENGGKWTKGDGSVVDGFTIDQKAEEEILSFQVYHDCRGTDTFLGSTYFKLADLEAEHNGALFKKSVFQAKLIAPEKSSTFFKKAPTKTELDKAAKFSINFLAEFVPDIQFADTPSLSPIEEIVR